MSLFALAKSAGERCRLSWWCVLLTAVWLPAAASAGPVTNMPFEDTFEQYTNNTCLIDGTNGWYGSTNDTVVEGATNSIRVQTNFAYASVKAAMIPAEHTLSNRFAPNSVSSVWVQADVRVVLTDDNLNDGGVPPRSFTVDNTNAAATFYINTSGYFVVHNGAPSPSSTNSSNWVTLLTNSLGAAIPPRAESEWVRLKVFLDYGRTNWSLTVNHVELTNSIRFLNPAVTNLNGFDLYNGVLANTSFLDNVYISSAAEPPPDLDVVPRMVTNSTMQSNAPAPNSFQFINYGSSMVSYTNTIANPEWVVSTNTATALFANSTNTINLDYSAAITNWAPGASNTTATLVTTSGGGATQTVYITMNVMKLNSTPGVLSDCVRKATRPLSRDLALVNAGAGSFNYKVAITNDWVGPTNTALTNGTLGAYATNTIPLEFGTSITSWAEGSLSNTQIKIVSTDGGGATNWLNVSVQIMAWGVSTWASNQSLTNNVFVGNTPPVIWPTTNSHNFIITNSSILSNVLNYTIAVTNNNTWLALTTNQGSVATNRGTNIYLTYSNTAGFNPGASNTTVCVSDGTVTQRVGVTLNLMKLTNGFAIGSRTNMAMFGQTATSISVNVINEGDGSFNYCFFITNNWVTNSPNGFLSSGPYSTNNIVLNFANSGHQTASISNTQIKIVSTNGGGATNTIDLEMQTMQLLAVGQTNGITNTVMAGKTPPNMTLTITNFGVGRFNFALTNTTNVWLGFSPSTGTLTTSNGAAITLLFSNTAGWVAGNYSNTTVLITSSDGGGATQAVPVRLNVMDLLLGVTNSITNSIMLNRNNITNGSFTIYNPGTGTFTYALAVTETNASSPTENVCTWLAFTNSAQLTNATGRLGSGASSTNTITNVCWSTTNFAVGVTNAKIWVTSGDGGGATQTFTLVLNVMQLTNDATIKGGLTNSVMFARVPPTNQNVKVINAGPGTFNYQFTNINPWVTNTPTGVGTNGPYATNTVWLTNMNTTAWLSGSISNTLIGIFSTNYGGATNTFNFCMQVMQLLVPTSTNGLTNYVMRGLTPSNINLIVTNNGVGNFNFALSVPSNNTWLGFSTNAGSLTTSNGTVITMSFSNTAGWAANANSNTTVFVTSTDGGGATQAVPVCVAVTDLQLSQTNITNSVLLRASTNNALSTNLTFRIYNPYPTGTFTYAVSSSNNEWVSCSSNTGTLIAGAAGTNILTLVFSNTPATWSPGASNTTIKFVSTAGGGVTQYMGVVLNVNQMQLSPTNIVHSTMRRIQPASKTFQVSNLGPGWYNYTVSPTNSWLTNAPTGLRTNTAPTADTITLSFPTNMVNAVTNWPASTSNMFLNVWSTNGVTNIVGLRMTVFDWGMFTTSGVQLANMSNDVMAGRTPTPQTFVISNMSGAQGLTCAVASTEIWMTNWPGGVTDLVGGAVQTFTNLYGSTEGWAPGASNTTVNVVVPLVGSAITQSIAVVLNVMQMSLSSTAVTNYVMEGEFLPAAQTFQVRNLGPGFFNYTLDNGGAAWGVTPTGDGNVGGYGTSTVTLTFTRIPRTPVTNTATITVASTNGGGATNTFGITLVVIARPAGPALNFYAATNGLHLEPFTNWSMAATNIASVLDIVRDGNNVFLSNNTFNLAAKLTITNSIVFQGWDTNASSTILAGDGSANCLLVNSTGAYVSGMTIRNGQGGTDGAAGVALPNGGTLSNCWIVANTSAVYAGGLFASNSALVVNCVVSGNVGNVVGGVDLRDSTLRNTAIGGNLSTNAAGYGGGLLVGGALAADCSAVGNAGNIAGGLYVDGGTLTNCWIAANTSATYAGGLVATNSAQVLGGVISGNVGNVIGGVDLRGATLRAAAATSACIVANVSTGAAGYGGGLVVGTNAWVADCMVLGNAGNVAGGLYVDGGTLTNCWIAANTSATYAGGLVATNSAWMLGGAISGNVGNAVGGADLQGAVFRDLAAVVANVSTGAAGAGGGLNLGRQPGNLVTNCVIRGNAATNLGGGVAMAGGAIESCAVVNNIQGDAAGAGGAGIAVVGTNAGQDIMIRLTTIASNTAASVGGGVLLTNAPAYSRTLRNCLVSSNSPEGVFQYEAPAAPGMDTIESCAIVSNAGTGLRLAAGQTNVFVRNTIAYFNQTNIIAGLGATTNGFFNSCASYGSFPAGRGNLTNDPLFAAADAFNYRLASNSPCLGAGTNQDWMTNAVDLDGNARISGVVVDIGAYEFVWGWVLDTQSLSNKVMVNRTPATQTFKIVNLAADRLDYKVTNATWLSGSITNASVAGYATNTIQVVYAPATAWAPGQSNATLTVTVTNMGSPQTRTVGVTLDVMALQASATGLTSSIMQGSLPASQSISISNAGSGTFDFTVTNSLWLSGSATNGSLGPYSNRTVNVNYSTNIAIWGPGASNTALVIASTNGGGATQTVSVTVNVMYLSATPAQLTNAVMLGGTPLAQSLTLRNTGAGTFNYSVAKSASWLAHTPTNGSLGAGATATVQIIYSSTAGWAPGVSNASITVTSTNGGGAVRVVPVVLDVVSLIPPAGVSATKGTYTDKVQLTWTPAANATGYQVWRNTVNSSASATLQGSQADTVYNDTSATQGVTYYYWVKSTNYLGISAFSSSDYGARKLPAPTGVSATKRTYTDKVRVTWSATTYATGYQVWRNLSNNTASASQLGSATSTTYDDATAVKEITYYYWVKATNSTSVSGFSSPDTGIKKEDTPAPEAPAGLSASQGTYTNKVELAWRASTYATSYEVWRNTVSSSASAAKLASPTVTNYSDTTTLAGTNYYYWVKAKNTTGTSTFSSVASGYCIDLSLTPLYGDFDGDRKSDPAVYQGATGKWFVRLSANGYSTASLSGFGGSGYIAFVGDYDGDSKADLGVFERSTGNWQVKLSRSGYSTATAAGFGDSSSAIVACDFDGDGLVDPSIYNTVTGTWRIMLSGSGYGIATVTGFGGTGFTQVTSTYDADRLADPAIYGTGSGNWAVMLSSQGYYIAALSGFGGAGSDPLTADFDGDGKADLTIYTGSAMTWYVKLSGSGYGLAVLSNFGGDGYLAGATDFDGDRRADPTLFRNANRMWYIKLSASGYGTVEADCGYTP